MIKTAQQLKAKIRNLSHGDSSYAQVLMRIYMMERFMERVSLSPCRDVFILKGGMLISSLVGVELRSTLDIDATVKGKCLELQTVQEMIGTIISVKMDDGVSFLIRNVSQIMDECDYPGVRVELIAQLERVKIPLKIDISTGDAITPREIRFHYDLMFENRSIDVWAYNLETIMAEKLETMLARATFNTRMRDFYDVWVLSKFYDEHIDRENLHAAFMATMKTRGSEVDLASALNTLDEIESSGAMRGLWASYAGKFSYVAGLTWEDAVLAARNLCRIALLPNAASGDIGGRGYV